ncbi:hypothetical protein Tsubulata_026467 [Turnera subulata]|uniref:Growth-regulating factor n=1 Tax=Turnera subulata TaxID=218843 RepID=A0A9Q0FU57_9ROSI|nr:hypothetical protein Tsubulata_026467 [Turnera subulata]
MGMRSGGFLGSKERATTSTTTNNKVSKEYSCDVGLGLRMQAKESCTTSAHKRPAVMMLMSHHDYSHHDHELSPPSYGFGGFGDGAEGGSASAAGCGPMFCETSNPAAAAAAASGGIFDVVSRASGSGANEAIPVLKSHQHPFDSSSSSSVFNYSGEMVPPVNVRVPFTAAQWQELERQTMICKYMMASVPVPPELLVPISSTQSPTLHSQSNSSTVEMKVSSGHNSDPEPWRCKRTDGKKWRCSRDVAPDQKYCERHSHKGRPRSRKPVELQTDSMMTIHNSNYIGIPYSLNSQKSHFLPGQTNCHLSMSPTAISSYDHQQPRSLDWFLKGETTAIPVATNSPQGWQHFRTENIKGGSNDHHQQHYTEEQINSNPCLAGGYSHQTQRQLLDDHQCSLSLNPNTSSTTPNPRQTEAQVTRHFLEAWSSAVRENIGGGGGGIGNNKASSVSPSGKSSSLPLSSLTLSMSGASEANEDNENSQVGSFGIMGSEDKDDHGMGVVRPQWMADHSSWLGSPPGGPLAEALCLGISSSAKSASDKTD